MAENLQREVSEINKNLYNIKTSLDMLTYVVGVSVYGVLILAIAYLSRNY